MKRGPIRRINATTYKVCTLKIGVNFEKELSRFGQVQQSTDPNEYILTTKKGLSNNSVDRILNIPNADSVQPIFKGKHMYEESAVTP